MRRFISIKMLFRSPLKSLLTFMLIIVASFALFSRVTDYAITSREEANARSFYHGVAALDNSVPDGTFEGYDNGLSYSYSFSQENKEWPSAEEIKELTSLSGATLTDNRYMTAGLVDNYKRLVDKDYGDYNTSNFVVEGTYSGYDTYDESSQVIDILLNDVTVLAGEIELSQGIPLKVQTFLREEEIQGKEGTQEEEHLNELVFGDLLPRVTIMESH